MSTTKKQTLPRTLVGEVVSNKMKDTIVVLVERQVMHPVYKKYIKRSTRVYVHDAGNTCQMGDRVLVQECRPISKTKCWKLVEIKEKAIA
ncbi:MAG TPA: 30S ribosomal protein S17 [Coxiellaceae bacterium]|nr:30S ribosomal protein S17 [Coxiellaceae bacterium]